MKIVTWNANMAFRNKYKLLDETFSPDVLVIQECENNPLEKYFPYFIWTGDNENKGLGVYSKFKIEKIKIKKSDSKYFIPFKIKDFFFIGAWAMNNKENPQNRYIAQVWNFLNENRELLKEKILILGDFNWNIIWDKKPSYRLSGNFNDVLNLLADFNIQSVYHQQYMEKFGEEKCPTFYMHRNKNKPYHIDYIFSKKEIKINNIIVGIFTDWINNSDHMPIFINAD